MKRETELKELLNIAIVLIAYFAMFFLPYIINFETKLTYSNSIIALVLFIGFMYLLKKSFIKENISKIKNISPLGLMLSASLVLGNSIKTNQAVDYKDLGIYFAILFISFIIDAILIQLYRFIEKVESKEEKTEQFKLNGNKRYIIIFLLLLLCWIPVFLSAYPGYFCYDAHTQLMQYIEGRITAQHPPVHTILLGFIINTVFNITSSYNIAIAVYTLLQMMIISACFTYCIYFMEKYKVLKYIRNASIIYYAFFPVVIMFAMCSTKDSLFSVAVLLSIIFAIEALLDKDKFINSKWLKIRFIIVIFLALILRNNAICVYIPFLIIYTIVFKNKKVLLPIASIVLLYIIYTVIICYGFNLPQNGASESLSVPLQQIARVYNINKDSLTEDEINKIYEYTSDEQLKKYNPACSDQVKRYVNISKIGYYKFFTLWHEIGQKNPRYIY